MWCFRVCDDIGGEIKAFHQRSANEGMLSKVFGTRCVRTGVCGEEGDAPFLPKTCTGIRILYGTATVWILSAYLLIHR